VQWNRSWKSENLVHLSILMALSELEETGDCVMVPASKEERKGT
jgi:hypothetical protein